MIRHVIRQERTGGFWLIRDAGRVVPLGPAAWSLVEVLHADGGVSTAEALERHRRRMVLDGEVATLAELDAHGLLSPDGWTHTRFVPSDVPLDALPAHAVAAPKRIYFEITRGCNLACKSCFNNSHHRLPNELTHAELLDVNRQAHALGVFEIRYTGGECTTVPGFAELVADARRRGFYVSIGTNGVYTDAQLEWLPRCGIDWFIISLDGDRQANDRVRGRGTYDRVMHTLSVLRRVGGVRIRLNMTVARHNVDRIADVAAVCAEHGVQSLNLIPLRPYGRSTIRMTQDMFTQADFYGFIHEVNRLRRQFPAVTFSTTIDLLDPTATTSHDLIVQKTRTCAAGVEACVVGPQGHVYGCSYSPASFPDSADEEGKRIFIAGNLRADDLRTIWRDEARWAVFRDLEQYKNPKCHGCGHYTVRCSGSCQIMAWYQLQHQREKGLGDAALKDFYDPYCFVELLDGRDAQAQDPAAPCGGAGMDGF